MVLGFYGASGLGLEYNDIAQDVNALSHKWEDIIFIDDDPSKRGTDLQGIKIFSFDEVRTKYKPEEIEIIISIGEPNIKDIVFEKVKTAGYKLGTLIHPTSSLGVGVKLGEGVVIQSFNRIPPAAVLGNNVLIQGVTCLGHNLVVGKNAVISSLVFIGGDTVIGENTYIAPHSCIRNQLKIGKNAIIGMGSVVTKDIPDNAVAYGNPCEVKRINESGRVFSK